MTILCRFTKGFIASIIFIFIILSQRNYVFAEVYKGLVVDDSDKIVITNISDISRKLILRSGSSYELRGNMKSITNTDKNPDFSSEIFITENKYKLSPPYISISDSLFLDEDNREDSEVGYDRTLFDNSYISEKTKIDVKEFFVLEESNPKMFRKLYSGMYCDVYGRYREDFFSVSHASQIGLEFDNFVYPKLTQNFGNIYMPKSDEKIILLCYDIDGDLDRTSPIISYRAGAFFAGDVSYGYANSSGNNAYILHLDTYPAMGFDKNNLCSNIPGIYSTIAHEFQHMLSFSYSYKNTYPGVPFSADLLDTWISEVLSESAVAVYDGPQEYRIDDYNSSSVNGSSLIDFSGTVGDYSLAYLFGQYIRVQYGNNLIYREILRRIETDADYLQIVCDILNEKNDYLLSKEDLIFNFNVALQAKEKTGEFGFMGEPVFSKIENKLQKIESPDSVTLNSMATWVQYVSGIEDLAYFKKIVEFNPFYRIASVKQNPYTIIHPPTASSIEILSKGEVNIPPSGADDNIVAYSAVVRDQFSQVIPNVFCEFKMLGIKDGVRMSADGELTVSPEAGEDKIIISASYKNVESRMEIQLVKSSNISVNEGIAEYVIPRLKYAREGQIVQIDIKPPNGMLLQDEKVNVHYGEKSYQTDNFIFTMPDEDVVLSAEFRPFDEVIYEKLSNNVGDFSFLKYFISDRLDERDFSIHSLELPVKHSNAVYSSSNEYLLDVSFDLEYNLYDTLIFSTPFAKVEINASMLSQNGIDDARLFMFRNNNNFIFYLFSDGNAISWDDGNMVNPVKIIMPIDSFGYDSLMFDKYSNMAVVLQNYNYDTKSVTVIPNKCGIIDFVSVNEERQNSYNENIREYVKFNLERGIVIGQSDQALNLSHDLDISMLVTILFRISGCGSVEGEFAENSGEWYLPYINFAENHKILLPDDNFYPYDKVNYSVYKTLVKRFIKTFNLHNGGIKDFSFIDLSDYEYISADTDAATLSRLDGLVLIKELVDFILK